MALIDSKTPKFDTALDAIFMHLSPHSRICRECNTEFKIEEEDIDFYKMLRVPPPTLCPMCRELVRQAFVNYTTFYKRKCDVPGHEETMISQIPEGAPFPVYDFKWYWGMEWSLAALDFSSKESFFGLFRTLFNLIPQPANTKDIASENSEYAAYGLDLKNCYFVFGGMSSENILYSNWPLKARDSVDILVGIDSEQIYESVYVEKCFKCSFAYFSNNCIDSAFLYDCRNCSYCFGCVNLRNKSYCFFNEQLSESEYKQRIGEISLSNAKSFENYRRKFIDLVKSLPKRGSMNENSSESTGVLLKNCRKCKNCFFIMGGENLKYTSFETNAKDCMDVLLGVRPQKCYFSVSPYDGFEIKFSSMTRSECRNIEYSINLKTCEDCFGCAGLVNKKFCIFNKQFDESEYWSKLDEIKTAMLERGEYGEFFPLSFSPFAYNSSLAWMSHQISDNEAKEKDVWIFKPAKTDFGGGITEIDNIEKTEEITDDLLSGAFVGSADGRPFRIIPEELAFYKNHGLPLPKAHPETRIKERFAWLNFLNLDEVRCEKCGVVFHSALHKDIRTNLLCETCYQNEVS